MRGGGSQNLTGFLTAAFIMTSSWTMAERRNNTRMKPIDPHYLDPYRPQIHYSCRTGWLSDPNGLFYYDGEYHLMFQNFSNRAKWDNSTDWGHAVSKDMLHWKHMPTALPHNATIQCYSGCAVVDIKNESGLGDGKRPPVLAFYTRVHTPRHPTKQGNTIAIAYSLDKGETWVMPDDLSVVDNTANPELKDERDPTVAWDKRSGKWVMATTGGGGLRVYTSANLLDWSFEGASFSVAGLECPDISIMKVEETGEEKYLVITSTNSGQAPNSSHGTMYHVCDFDGTAFIQLGDKDKKRWLDWGSDFYAGITYASVPDGRVLFQSWFGWPCQWNSRLSRTTKFSGTMNVIRELTLHVDDSGEYHVRSRPIPEYEKLRRNPVTLSNVSVSDRYTVRDDIGSHEPVELILEAVLPEESTFGVRLKNGFGEDYYFKYDGWYEQFTSDRTNAGTLPNHIAGFPAGYNKLAQMPYRLSDGTLKLHIFFDVSTFEAFIDDGREVFSELVYPREPFTTLELFSFSGKAEVKALKMFTLESIWAVDD